VIGARAETRSRADVVLNLFQHPSLRLPEPCGSSPKTVTASQSGLKLINGDGKATAHA
jgi:hypothetical protein